MKKKIIDIRPTDYNCQKEQATINTFATLWKKNWSKDTGFVEFMNILKEMVVDPITESGGEAGLGVIGLITFNPFYIAGFLPLVIAIGGKTAIQYLISIRNNKKCLKALSEKNIDVMEDSSERIIKR